MADNETLGHKEGMEHLALVQALSQEVSSAISAIEKNDLAELSGSHGSIPNQSAQ